MFTLINFLLLFAVVSSVPLSNEQDMYEHKVMKTMAMGHHKKHHKLDQDGSGEKEHTVNNKMYHEILERCE